MSEENIQTESDDVEIIHRVNRLKKKVSAQGKAKDGDGHIDANAIERAQNVIKDSQAEYLKEVGNVLTDLNSAWTSLLRQEEGSAPEDIDRYANRIKDMASTYGFDIMTYFSKSLRDFSQSLDVANEAHQTIVKAHLDVMNIALHEKLKTHDDPMAEKLKVMLNKAIVKHSAH
jgi:hypothetical protein